METGELWIRAFLGLAGWLAAFAAIALGRNLTRSLSAAYVFLAALIAALVLAGSGYGAWVLVIGAGSTFALVQVFGWMLVDVDQDHLPPTESGTRAARGLAFVVLALTCAALVFFARDELALGASVGAHPSMEVAGAASSGRVGAGAPARVSGIGTDAGGHAAGTGLGAAAVGRILFAALQPQLILLGLAIGAGLLAALLLLRDDPDARDGRGLDA